MPLNIIIVVETWGVFFLILFSSLVNLDTLTSSFAKFWMPRNF